MRREKNPEAKDPEAEEKKLKEAKNPSDASDESPVLYGFERRSYSDFQMLSCEEETPEESSKTDNILQSHSSHSWRVLSFSPIILNHVEEKLDEETFIKRHEKHEIREKRIKRKYEQRIKEEERVLDLKAKLADREEAYWEKRRLRKKLNKKKLPANKNNIKKKPSLPIAKKVIKKKTQPQPCGTNLSKQKGDGDQQKMRKGRKVKKQ